MRPDELESEILLYWIQYRELEEKGGPEQDGDLFETVMDREEAILTAFGLPPAQKYSRILWKLTDKKSCPPKAVQKTISKLQEEAQQFHEISVKPSLVVLKEAMNDKVSFTNALPELGFLTHIYTIFLYNELLLKKKASPEAILKELETVRDQDLYEQLGTLRLNLKPTFRRTKIYKALKEKLQFLDVFLETEDTFPDQETLWDGIENEPPPVRPKENSPSEPLTRQDAGHLPAPKPYYPEYKILLGFLEIKEIIFDANETVTVNAIHTDSGPPRNIGLGFEFEALYNLLLAYCRPNTGILSYFNKTRQRNLLDFPTIINLKDKLGQNLELNQHYLRVYKPQALNREGQPEEMTEEFYLVDDILLKKTFDAGQRRQLRSTINGWFGHFKNWYPIYLNAKAQGLSEMEARRSIGLENEHLFNLSRLLYLLEKHGGRAKMQE